MWMRRVPKTTPKKVSWSVVIDEINKSREYCDSTWYTHLAAQYICLKMRSIIGYYSRELASAASIVSIKLLEDKEDVSITHEVVRLDNNIIYDYELLILHTISEGKIKFLKGEFHDIYTSFKVKRRRSLDRVSSFPIILEEKKKKRYSI